MRCASVLVVLLVACGGSDDAPPSRDIAVDVTVAANGLSEEVEVRIPDGTRSITVIAEGAPQALYALGAFALGDGTDLVALPAGEPGPAMRDSYNNEQIGHMPGGLYQSIRLGTFTHIYPYAPAQTVIAGTGFLRIASDTPGPVRVRVLMPEEDGATVLPLNLYLISDTLAEPMTTFNSELERLFAQAAITVRINGIERLTGTAYERITDFSEPQESPTSQSAMLTSLVADRTTDGLDVFFVESLPTGVAGLSLGTPGPPTRGSYYFGVLVRGGFQPGEQARIVAHEVAHFLALQHIVNRGISGTSYPDPLDDTMPGVDNLMDDGTLLTAGQAFALSRSALLVPVTR
jgi:hypothetical protein